MRNCGRSGLICIDAHLLDQYALCVRFDRLLQFFQQICDVLCESCDAHQGLRVHEAIHDAQHQQLVLDDELVHEPRLNVELNEYHGEEVPADGEAIHDGLKHERARNIGDLYVELARDEHFRVINRVYRVNHDDSHASRDDPHAFRVGPTSHADALLHVIPPPDGNDVEYHQEDQHQMVLQKLVHNVHQVHELRGNVQLVHRSARLCAMAHCVQARIELIHRYRLLPNEEYHR